MAAAIVLDKSFLQGVATSRFRELARSHRFLVSDALFYELLTSEEPVRSSCFRKFPPTENPVELVSHIGPLVRLEIISRKPSGLPSMHRQDLRFQFNWNLTTPVLEFSETERRTIEEHASELRSDVEAFMQRANLIPTFFPDILSGSQSKRERTIAEVEAAIATPGALLNLYSALEVPPGEKTLPPAGVISEDWAIYRWLQVQLLFAADLYVRYNGRIPTKLTKGTFERMEHDVLDAQLLMLGCLEGAFATKEKKLMRWLKVLCPRAELYE